VEDAIDTRVDLDHATPEELNQVKGLGKVDGWFTLV
jgi:hypothetical protein